VHAPQLHGGAVEILCGADVRDDDATWREEGTPFRDSEKVLGELFEKNRYTGEDYT